MRRGGASPRKDPPSAGREAAARHRAPRGRQQGARTGAIETPSFPTGEQTRCQNLQLARPVPVIVAIVLSGRELDVGAERDDTVQHRLDVVGDEGSTKRRGSSREGGEQQVAIGKRLRAG